VKKMVEQGMISQEEVDYLVKFSMSERFGWTPEQIDNLDFKDFMAYHIISSTIDKETPSTPKLPGRFK
jgi:hypothetical protein